MVWGVVIVIRIQRVEDLVIIIWRFFLGYILLFMILVFQ